MNKEIETKIRDIAAQYPDKKSSIMPALDLVQRENDNFLSADEIKEVAALLDVSESKAHGVATYYTMFNTKKAGKYHLQVDTCIPAFLNGADEIVNHLKNKLNIEVGETTDDGLFTLATVEDLGSCGTCPVIQVNDTYYENMTLEKVDQLIDSLTNEKMPEPDSKANFATECNILLKNRNKDQATDIAVYKKDGGYTALKKALGMKPEEIVLEVKEAMIKGRGGAGFPAGTKWGFLPKDDPRPVYFICNADEGEPGTFKDRQIMQYDPHLLIEGIAISAYAVKAKKTFIYIRGEFRFISDILENAIDQAKADGQLDHVDIVVHRGAGSYVCGDETALMESIEGKRGNPRVKPPFPANIGLYGCPTIINNVETLSCIPFVIEKGADEFKKIGTTGNFGPKIFGVSGHINKPGAYEYPLGTPFKEILSAAGGVKGNLKAVIVGGLSVPILKADEIAELKLDYDSCVKAGTMLGSGGIMVINDTVSIPELALRTIEFYAHESCGQCVPCREGSSTVEALLKKLLKGQGTKDDIDIILNLAKGVVGLTLCPMGDAWGMPIEAMVKKFKTEFEALVKK
ncbi:NADH-quinone oxidoreductase subunit NuoF [Candidatus Auribacterota bacterium]